MDDHCSKRAHGAERMVYSEYYHSKYPHPCHPRKEGRFDRWNATRVLGFILMIRTNRGQIALEKISKPRRFGDGESSLWLCVFILLITTVVIILSAIALISQPTSQSLDTSDVLLILV